VALARQLDTHCTAHAGASLDSADFGVAILGPTTWMFSILRGIELSLGGCGSYFLYTSHGQQLALDGELQICSAITLGKIWSPLPLCLIEARSR
jgi:hypothetical protein